MVNPIRQGIRQEKPFRTREAEAFVSLLFTTDRVRDVALEPLRTYGLSGEQYNVLRILRGAGPDGLRTSQVVGRMVSRAPNVTRLVDKLDRKGLLERRRSSRDRRVITLRIRPEGLRVLEELDAPMDRSIAKAIHGLTQEEIGSLVVLLGKLCGPIGPAPGGSGSRLRRRLPNNEMERSPR